MLGVDPTIGLVWDKPGTVRTMGGASSAADRARSGGSIRMRPAVENRSRALDRSDTVAMARPGRSLARVRALR